MEVFVSCLLASVAGLIAVPIAVFCLEIVAGVLRPNVPELQLPKGAGVAAPPRVAVLVPAHNEGEAIVATLNDIKAQLNPRDRLVVVADNCIDDTAAVARAAGAEVVERHDTQRIGKGYALDWGVRYLDRRAPDIVVMVDADCRVAVGAITHLARACTASGRPVQALYLMTGSRGAHVEQQIAEFAWRLKNWVRPLGLAALGQPCQLMGAGMAFPWAIIRKAAIASGSIVEDLKLGLELAAANHPPLFYPLAFVRSRFAASPEGAKIQRQRWEQGHIEMIRRNVPPLIRIAHTQKNLGLLALTLDLLVPPLSLLCILAVLMVLIAAFAALCGLSAAALVISLFNLLAFAFATYLAWSKFGRDVVPLRAALSIPAYVGAKIGLYGHVLFNRRATQWLKIERRNLD